MRPAPRVTILMTLRERRAYTEPALDTLRKNTPLPHRLVYADVQSSPERRAALRARADRGELELVCFDEPLWPNQVRQRLVPEFDTDYVVLIDNDVTVHPGWLEALVNCADETGAAIVAPLYLWGEDPKAPRVHMAGGTLERSAGPEGGTLVDGHRLMDAPLDKVEAQLRRERCGYAEYHCMLVRRDLAQDPEFFDANIVCVHEHIHASLLAEARGGETWFEPTSRVAYRGHAPYRLEDLPTFRQRWAREAGEASIRAFARRWNIADDERSFGPVRFFLSRHVANVDPLRPGLARDGEARMTAADLRHDAEGLLELARARGYGAPALKELGEACAYARQRFAGLRRPCGRPFFEHLAGTASVMLFYGLRIVDVTAALLHSLYSHPRPGEAPASPPVQQAIGGAGSALESRVRAYTLRQRLWRRLARTPVPELKVSDAEIVLIAVANEIEMHLSGEMARTGRPMEIEESLRPAAAQICRCLGLPALGIMLGELPMSVRRSAQAPAQSYWEPAAPGIS